MIFSLFCKHKWKGHSKKTTSVSTTEVVSETKIQEHTYHNTTEILICEKCGKIKRLQY